LAQDEVGEVGLDELVSLPETLNRGVDPSGCKLSVPETADRVRLDDLGSGRHLGVAR
jgi:hypothetical protein